MDGAEKWRDEQDWLVDWMRSKRVKSKRVRVAPQLLACMMILLPVIGRQEGTRWGP